MSKNENLKKTLPTASACKGVEHGFGTPPSSSVHGKIPKITESVVIKDMTFFPHHSNNFFETVSASAFLTKSTVSHKYSSFYFKYGLIVHFLLFCPK